jgi:hypothetical protein
VETAESAEAAERVLSGVTQAAAETQAQAVTAVADSTVCAAVTD